MQRKVPVRVMSMTLPHWSSVISVIAAVPPSPALLTITSRPPNSSAASISACTCASSVTSQTSVRTRSAPNSSPSASSASAEPALVGVAEHDGLGALLQHPAYDGRADAGSGGRGHDDDLVAQQVVGRHVVGRGLLGSGRRHRRLPAVLGFAGQAEHALGQDVALDLVGAAVDRVGPGEQEQPLPLVEVVVRAGGQRVGCRAPASPAHPACGASRPTAAWRCWPAAAPGPR